MQLKNIESKFNNNFKVTWIKNQGNTILIDELWIFYIILVHIEYRLFKQFLKSLLELYNHWIALQNMKLLQMLP